MEDSVKETNKQTTDKQIELAFPKYEEGGGEYISKGRGEDLIKYLSDLPQIYRLYLCKGPHSFFDYQNKISHYCV